MPVKKGILDTQGLQDHPAVGHNLWGPKATLFLVCWFLGTSMLQVLIEWT